MREVLNDCHSEQVQALIEEHNVLVDALKDMMGGRVPAKLPRRIEKKEEGT